MADDEMILPLAPSIGDAILAVERWSRKLHSQQRLMILDNLAVPDRVAHLMRDVNRALSSPDEKQDLAFGRRANELLRNATVKSQLASFLALEGLIERLASITSSQGELDRTLSDPAFLRSLDANQLIALQRSQHAQTMEILEVLEKKKFDSLSSVVSALSTQAEEEVHSGLGELAKLKLGGREKVGHLLSKLLTAVASKSTMVETVTKALTETTRE